MSTHRDETRRLRDLHEDYAWRVNAAVGEGREDLVWKLADEYLIKAMQAMTDEHFRACERSDCPICTQPRAVGLRRAPRRGRLWRLLAWKRAHRTTTA